MQDSHSCDPGSIPGQCTFFFFLPSFTHPLTSHTSQHAIFEVIVTFFGFFLKSLLAPITDLHYCHQPSESVPRTGENTKRSSNRVEASKMALVSLLKCWPGIFCLCNHHNLGMTSLLNMLPLARPEVQREILDVLYGVFQLKVPEWTSNYNEALASIGECS